jgi:predicted RNase H-like nuclease
MDGCRGGWVLVTVPVGCDGDSVVEVVPDINHAIALLRSGELAAIGIDIPIGLPDRGPRACDVEARKRVGRRSSSVFPAPLRCVLGSPTYEEACARSLAACGRMLSKQVFGIVPKIEAVDAAIDPRLQSVLVEVHPEVSFAAMAGRPLVHPKVTPDGRAERLELLRPKFGDVDTHTTARLRGAKPDDLLDAFATAWSARRMVSGRHTVIGGDLDARGLRMQIVA